MFGIKFNIIDGHIMFENLYISLFIITVPLKFIL